MERVFYESYDLNRVKYLVTLSNEQLKEAINSSKKEQNTREYIKGLKQFFKDIIASKDGTMRTTYHRAKNRTDGRKYSNGMRLQGLSKNIRNFIVKDTAKDYDLVNCFPSLLLYLCKTHIKNESVYPLLNEFVNDRANVLATHGITKQDVLVNMNKDNPRPKNEYLKKFVREQHQIKTLLLPFVTEYTDFKTDNTTNPTSSMICQMLNVIEDTILTEATKPYREVALIFDGFMAFEAIDLTALNNITQPYGLVWTIKPLETTIKMPEDFKYNDYQQDRALFHKTNHIIRNPLMYMRLSDGDWCYNDKHTTDQLYANMPKYTADEIPFLKMWYADPGRLEYETTNFIPYNRDPPKYDASKIFNTFKPFSRANTPPTPTDYEYAKPLIAQFINLLLGLCENNITSAEYLGNYIAHLIQYPERLPETIIVLQGREGAGKDTLIDIIERLLDNSKDYVVRTEKPDLILGRFNSYVKDSLVVQLNEFSNANAIQYKEQLKNLATERVIPIEFKNVDKKVMVNNYARIFLFSNNNRPVVVGESNRRFCAFRTTDKHIADKTFFGTLYKYLEDPIMVNGLFHYLNTLPITDFDPRQFPRGSLYSALREESIHHIYKFLYNIDPYGPNVKKGKKNNCSYIRLTDLREMFLQYGASEGVNVRNIKTGQMKLELGKDSEYIKFIKKDGYDYCKFVYTELQDYLRDKYFNTDNCSDSEDEFE